MYVSVEMAMGCLVDRSLYSPKMSKSRYYCLGKDRYHLESSFSMRSFQINFLQHTWSILLSVHQKSLDEANSIIMPVSILCEIELRNVIKSAILSVQKAMSFLKSFGNILILRDLFSIFLIVVA